MTAQLAPRWRSRRLPEERCSSFSAGDRGRRAAPWSGGLLLFSFAAPLPWFAADALAAVPASDALTPARIASGPSAGDAGRLFVSVHDAHLLSRFVTSGTSLSLVEKVRRAHAAMAGYGNLRAGVATAGTASPNRESPPGPAPRGGTRRRRRRDAAPPSRTSAP